MESETPFIMTLKALTPLLAALALSAPAALADHKVKVYRDLDGDGHYNKKSYKLPHYGYRDRYYGGSGYGYGYRPYYGYGYPRYYGYSYPRTTFGLSFSTRPTYYSSSRVYRPSSYSTNNSLAAEVQSALKRRGYYRGAIDGDIGSGSRAAIRAYQRDRGLSVTGRIDSALLRSLRIG